MNGQMISDCWVKYKAVSDEGDVQNLCVLQRLIEMVKVRQDDIFMALGIMEKTYYDIQWRSQVLMLGGASTLKKAPPLATLLMI